METGIILWVLSLPVIITAMGLLTMCLICRFSPSVVADKFFNFFENYILTYNGILDKMLTSFFSLSLVIFVPVTWFSFYFFIYYSLNYIFGG